MKISKTSRNLKSPKKTLYLPKSKADFDFLRLKATHSELIEKGLKVWEITEKGTHYLYPPEWYNVIPTGYPVYDIFEEKGKFNKRTYKNEARFGAMTFGFFRKK